MLERKMFFHLTPTSSHPIHAIEHVLLNFNRVAHELPTILYQDLSHNLLCNNTLSGNSNSTIIYDIFIKFATALVGSPRGFLIVRQNACFIHWQ